MQFKCAKCGHSREVPDKLQGKQVNCPKCGAPAVLDKPEKRKERRTGLFKCKCGYQEKVGEKAIGKKGKCPKCHEVSEVGQRRFLAFLYRCWDGFINLDVTVPFRAYSELSLFRKIVVGALLALIVFLVGMMGWRSMDHGNGEAAWKKWFAWGVEEPRPAPEPAGPPLDKAGPPLDEPPGKAREVAAALEQSSAKGATHATWGFGEGIGVVESLTGTAYATAGGKVRRLALDDVVYQGEELTTGQGSALLVRFKDGSQVAMGERSRLALDRYVYDPDAARYRLQFRAQRGVFRMKSGEIAARAPDNNTLEFPMSTVGVRGTTTLHLVRPDGEVHGVEEITPGKEVVVRDRSGRLASIGEAMQAVALNAGGMSPVRPITQGEMSIFQGLMRLVGLAPEKAAGQAPHLEAQPDRPQAPAKAPEPERRDNVMGTDAFKGKQ